MTDCVFCLDNWPNLDIVAEVGPCAIVRPLDPVIEGHVLVIDAVHTQDASSEATIAGGLMEVAAQYVAEQGIEANIITSIGPLATQTVMHTHLHVVPRVLNDDLPLPWTPQQMDKERWKRAMESIGQLRTNKIWNEAIEAVKRDGR